MDFEKYQALLKNIRLTKDSGKIIEVTGVLIKAFLPGASVGSVCLIDTGSGGASILAEVVGFKDREVYMMALGEMRGVSLGCRVTLTKSVATVKVSEELLGRVIDGQGEPIDSLGALSNYKESSIYAHPVNPLDREPIRKPLDVGVRAINATITVGRGQRICLCGELL